MDKEKSPSLCECGHSKERHQKAKESDRLFCTVELSDDSECGCWVYSVKENRINECCEQTLADVEKIIDIQKWSDEWNDDFSNEDSLEEHLTNRLKEEIKNLKDNSRGKHD